MDAVETHARRWWALAALVAAMLVLGFDLTILNVALPTLAGDLGATTGEQQWIVDAYVVVFAALMLPAGLLGDRFGRRRMLVTGLVVFLAGSATGALVHSPGPVIAARTVMGVGAALVMPLALSVLPSLFPAAERTKAVAAMTAAMSAGIPLGPLVGGWLLDHYWWGSVFLINVPLVGIALVVCLLLLPETRDPSAPRVDLWSAALSVAGLATLVLGIIEAPHRGWHDPAVLGLLAGSATLVALLVRRERRSERPLLDLALLADPGFRWNTLAATLGTFILAGLLFVVPAHLQAVLGHDAFGTGVRLLPLMAGLLVAAKLSTALAGRLGLRPVVATGLVVLCFAALLGARTGSGDGYGFTALWLSLAGLGFGCAMVPAMDAALGGISADRAGSGSGLLLTLRQVGGAIGIALLGSLLSGVYADRLDTGGLPDAAAATADDSVVAGHLVAERLDLPALAAAADRAHLAGMHLALVVCGCAALVAAGLVALFLPGGRNTTGKTDDGTESAPDGDNSASAAGPVRDVAPDDGDGREWTA